MAATEDEREAESAAAALDISKPVELVVLSLKQTTARCRLLSSSRTVTLRATRLWDLVPGEIVKIKPRKQWSDAGNPYLSGDIDSTRLEAGALGLTPLKITDRGGWYPAEHYWGEEDEPMEDWARPIIAWGQRRE